MHSVKVTYHVALVERFRSYRGMARPRRLRKLVSIINMPNRLKTLPGLYASVYSTKNVATNAFWVLVFVASKAKPDARRRGHIKARDSMRRYRRPLVSM